MRDNTQASKLLYQRLWSMAYKVLETNLANIMSAEHTQLNTPFPVTLFRVWEKPGDCSSGGDSSGISHSACVSIFDMLHSFAPRYSHPSIRHLQPFLMPGPCQTGQRHGCGHRQISHEVQMSDVSWERDRQTWKTPARAKFRAEIFYDVSWQQPQKTITLNSAVTWQKSKRPIFLLRDIA